MPSIDELLGDKTPFRRFRGTYEATVANIDDPQRRCRIRVSCPEVYGLKQSPWVEYGSEYGGFTHGGSVFVPPLGANIRIRFKNGDPNNPEFAGSIFPKKSVPKTALGESSESRQYRGTISVPSFIGSNVEEPNDQYAAEYPYNRVIESNAGHLIELDDTPGAERVNIHHGKTGTSLEISPDGTMLVQIRKKKFENIEDDSAARVKGDLINKYDNNVSIVIDKDGAIQIKGDLRFIAAGNVDLIAGGRFSIVSNDKVSIVGKNGLSLYSNGTLYSRAPIIQEIEG